MSEVIGEEKAKRFMRRVIDAAKARGTVLDHILLVGAAGTGKSTFANVIANELGVRVYQVEAPVWHEQLLQLREVMQRADVLFIDEIHQQAIMERRGRSTNSQPEVLFSVMEDRTIVSGLGVLPFPEITLIGATTDEGMLPDAFVSRFPLRPMLDPYSESELAAIAVLNAQVLQVRIRMEVARKFARASRGVPRQINNYVRNAALLTTVRIDDALADEVLADLNRVTPDGLTLDMQRTLTFLYTRQAHQQEGGITYQASVATIATAIRKSRDSKAVTLRVEPFLIEQGYLQVGHGGRKLTQAGVKRARQLLSASP